MTLYTLVYFNYFCTMFRKTGIYILLISAVISITGCSEFQRVMKSTDMEYKYAKGIEFYEREKYTYALDIFKELLDYYSGTLKQQEVYYYYCSSLYHVEDYILAGYHYKVFYQTFPSHPRAEESAFMTAKCYYLEAPKYSLDQSYTYKAINELQLFINTHAGSEYIPECNDMIDELRGKLELKSYEIAYQYYKTSRYQAAVTSFNTTLNDFPDTPYREEAMYYRLVSAYKLAENSILEKQRERYTEARTAYLDFIRTYPESEFRRDADKVSEQIDEYLNGK